MNKSWASPARNRPGHGRLGESVTVKGAQAKPLIEAADLVSIEFDEHARKGSCDTIPAADKECVSRRALISLAGGKLCRRSPFFLFGGRDRAPKAVSTLVDSGFRRHGVERPARVSARRFDSAARSQDLTRFQTGQASAGAGHPRGRRATLRPHERRPSVPDVSALPESPAQNEAAVRYTSRRLTRRSTGCRSTWRLPSSSPASARSTSPRRRFRFGKGWRSCFRPRCSGFPTSTAASTIPARRRPAEHLHRGTLSEGAAVVLRGRRALPERGCHRRDLRAAGGQAGGVGA